MHGNESGYALLTPEAITGVESPRALAETFLSQNSPNPFNPVTKIEFGLGGTTRVSLCIYDAAGHLVGVLIDGDRPAGRYIEQWDGRGAGGRVASGVYFYRLTAGDKTFTKKMVLLKSACARA